MDAAIVGAGPAGAWAAERLARAGARVTIFDPSHPREKPCGGGVTGRAFALVSDAVDPASFPRTVVHSARFVRSPEGESVIVPLEGQALIVASRAAFDAAILAAAVRAGAVLERTRVRDVRVDATGVRLDTDAGPRRASFVVGADGANSIVRRRLATPFRREQLSIATGVFARGVTSDEIVIEFDADPPGYFWSFPRPDHLAIGVCASADAGTTSGALRARAIAWATRSQLWEMQSRRSSRERASEGGMDSYSWPIPTLGPRDFDQMIVAGPRWALVGDAAGLVDPITREGIFFAIASGAWIADALARGDAASYRDRVYDQAVAELSRAARFKAAFFRPAFTGLLVGALRQSAGIRSVMADLIAGRQSYAALKWRLLSTWERGLAARAIRQAVS
jgi:geranylgeranyl reductase family protein